MNFAASLPATAAEFGNWTWPEIERYADALAERPLTTDTVASWLADWSRLGDLIDECYWRLYVVASIDTADKAAELAYQNFLDTIHQPFQATEQNLKRKLLDSGLEPDGFRPPLRCLRAEAALYRETNVPLLVEEQKLAQAYDQIVGAQTVQWDGMEIALPQITPMLQQPDRAGRERAWRLMTERQLADRQALNELWQKCLTVRQQLAANAGCCLADGTPDYRAYRWRQTQRFDYTPDDCGRFHRAVEEVVVPAAARVYERHRRRLGVSELRPWDLKWAQGQATVVDPPDVPALHPFDDVADLEAKCAAIFTQVDRAFGAYFETMRREKLLDLANRPNKAPSSYCTSYQVAQRPFIFMNAVGVQEDVQTLLHEAGHAFHAFERSRLPYHHQRAEHATTSEAAEMAAVALELLSAPYLAASHGGFYTEADAARARRAHLEESLLFWPYIAVVDAFQHWAYEHPKEAAQPDACDAHWQALWQRFMIGVDWDGLEEASMTRWQRQGHIFTVPFYFIEYGLAQLGAVQIWRNALNDRTATVARYRRALALGSTVSVPELYAAAGAKFAFDADTLRAAVQLIEHTIDELDRME